MDVKNIKLDKCIVHLIGNKGRKESIELSNNEIPLTEDLEKELKQYFLNPFKTVEEINKLHHDIDLSMNELFICTDKIFEKEDFIKNSIDIANHLYNQTRNPSIKSGELFVTLLNDVVINGIITQGVGIFKSERKDTFFEVTKKKSNQISIEINKGINKGKLDKGCIIVADDYQNGYKVYTYEHNGADTDYWRNDFLSIIPIEDEYQHTKQFLTQYKNYITKDLPKDIEITKAEQIDLVNRTVEYFKSNSEFNKDHFQQEVLENDSIIESFNSFNNNLSDGGNKLMDSFTISKNAVKKQARIFKSVLKLDKNFHIYIHGNRNLIEQGYDDEKGKKFYKVYFDEEI